MRVFPSASLTAASVALVVGLGSAVQAAVVRPSWPVAAPRSAQSLAKTQTLVYVSAFTAGVTVYTESGKSMGAFAQSTGANSVAMDDAGDVFVDYLKGSTPRVARYAIGGAKPVATYIPSKGAYLGLIQASHQGELIDFHVVQKGSLYVPVIDVWDAGVTGKPSRSFSYTGQEFAFALDNAGALYIPYYDAKSGTQDYAEIPAGASSPSRTIVDSLVPATEAAYFEPFTMTATTDGTLYVGEWSFVIGDTLAGLYVYPLHGAESYVTNGASYPAATAVDAAGKVYVLNSNYGISTSGYTCDTLHTLSVYSKGAVNLLSQATSGFTNGQYLTVSANGTSFITEFGYQPSQSCPDPQGAGALAAVAPGSSSGTTIVPNLPNENVSLYDGSVATNFDSQAEK